MRNRVTLSKFMIRVAYSAHCPKSSFVLGLRFGLGQTHFLGFRVGLGASKVSTIARIRPTISTSSVSVPYSAKDIVDYGPREVKPLADIGIK